MDVTLLQAIDADCAKFYKAFQCQLTQTKTKSDESQVIDLPEMKSKKIPNSKQFSNWLCSIDSI